MEHFTLTARGRTVTFPRRPLIMGILNINDDSFSGDGKVDAKWALERARELVAEGVDIVDVGAESARTNRAAITPGEEFARLKPFLEGFQPAVEEVSPRDEEQLFPPLLSVNTWRPEVAEPALKIGGHLLNDMSALGNEANARVCSSCGSGLVIMHSVGEPKVPHTHITYPDVVGELGRFFEEKISLAKRAGLPESSLVLDPGIDFAKQAPDNLRIYRELESLGEFRRPILLPVSRKSVIGRVLGISDPRERDAATAACIVSGMLRGASIFRVHNVEMAWRTIKTVHRVEGAVA